MTEPHRPAGSAEAAACHRRGLEFLKNNQASLGLAELERAVLLEPTNAEFLKSLGNARKAAGDLAGAMASFQSAVMLAPGNTTPLYNLALVLLDLGRPQEAEAHFRRILELDPRDAEVIFHLGLIAADRSQFAEAAHRYRSALELTPENPFVWFGLALACRQLPGHREESVRCLRQCLELKPDFADAHHELAVTLQAEGRLDDAEAHYRTALQHATGNAMIHCQLGNALVKAGRAGEAIGCYRKAVELDPGLALAHLNLGSAHALLGAYDEALRCYEAALKLQPGNAAARGSLLFEMQRVCDWSRFEELSGQQRAAALKKSEQEILPFSLLSIPSTPEEQLQCARHYAERQALAVARDRECLNFRHERRPAGKLRIGYLSADFREHPVASLIAELFELHDRGRFEITAYSCGPDDRSLMRARLMRAFDRFVEIGAMSHADAAARIHADRIDILVDLTGYTSLGRTEIPALRPAPIQVNYLGYPGTLGADFIDYIVTDRFITPPGNEAHLSEQPVYLPGSYQANDRKRAVADTPPRSVLGLPAQAFVFCCFNHTYKILPDVFAAWVRLLKAVPESVLWLLKSNAWAEQNLRREAQRHGIAPERLIFAPGWPQDRHLGRIPAADLFLDTLPYNAHTTASDALWAGLPVVTCAGNTFASRVAGSLLTAVGMPELVTRSMKDYEALALRLANNPGELAALRMKLARNRATTPLFDTPAITRQLETAYSRIWEIYLAGNPPRAIVL
jgi:predicted O-linked N-acetylglucosamine transferase (SPINDLY family)